MNRKSWWAATMLVLCGCVSLTGFNRNLLESRLKEDVQVVTDEEIKVIQTLSPQLQFPCRIAIALRGNQGDWRWLPKDRQAMEVWARTLQNEGIASDVVFMSTMFLRGDSLKDLRAAAAKYGADAVLVISGAAATESRLNPLAVFNLTVVGGFVLPASHRDALFLMEGGLVDVNNGFLYASVEAEGEGSILAPTFIIENRDAVERAKQEALKSFSTELLSRLRNLKASRPGLTPSTSRAALPGGSLIDASRRSASLMRKSIDKEIFQPRD